MALNWSEPMRNNAHQELYELIPTNADSFGHQIIPRSSIIRGWIYISDRWRQHKWGDDIGSTIVWRGNSAMMREQILKIVVPEPWTEDGKNGNHDQLEALKDLFLASTNMMMEKFCIVPTNMMIPVVGKLHKISPSSY